MTTTLHPDRLRVTLVEPSTLRAAAEEVVARGGTLDGLFAAGGPEAPEVRVVASAPGEDLLIRCPAPDGSVPSLTGIAAGLDWDQREARDLHGIVFDGDGVHRPLVHHPDDPAAWATPVTGEDVHDVAVGPIHAGVIESGHFRFHTVGERVLHVDVRLFHKHRGLERAAEGRAPADALPYVGRACAACAVANTVAFAQAVEGAAGFTPGHGLRRVRTLLLELERLWNHVNDIGQICAGVGLAPGAMVFAAAKERVQRVAADLTGHRFMFGSVAVGGSPIAIATDARADARARLADLRLEVALAWGALLHEASLRDRCRGAGVLDRADALRLGTVGPAARAAGVARDERQRAPRLWYDDFRAAVPPEPVGDVAARLEARAVEAEASFEIVDALLAAPLRSAPAEPLGAVSGHGVGRVESPRGLTWCAVELDEGVVRRVHLRTGSYANWPSVAAAAAGAILPDFPLVNKSFELCYACADR